MSDNTESTFEKNKKKILIAIAVVLLLILCALGYYYRENIFGWFGSKKSDTPASTNGAAASATPEPVSEKNKE